MIQFVCKQCGASDFTEEGSYRVCKYCGTKYKIETKDVVPLYGGIDIKSDVDRLLEKCRSDPKNARKYANRILDIDPTNKEALKYL